MYVLCKNRKIFFFYLKIIYFLGHKKYSILHRHVNVLSTSIFGSFLDV